ncbi:hypothetical protein M422DRAFT_60902 [Sphaerobolus stellatus SS14]|uniref:Acyl-CoA oxidase n=1 Tax=Sphaerobolus stellatus (strain SS14) TaxID=990650 RepID=A0A0C9V8H6_SPHS4|nr:hypothetical protein M422DRAFT_60902 [Sphaerobolus stellatus SS14]
MFQNSASLAETTLFQTNSSQLPHHKHIRLSFERAKAIVNLYKLTAEDILYTTLGYWQSHSDPILAMDGATALLLTTHYNLCCGTFAGCFCLTELGHGLDAINIETTALLLPDGSFLLNTQREEAAKYMPPTAPGTGIPSVAVVFARLIVAEEDRRIKPFMVKLYDGQNHRVLTEKGGAGPINHCLTSFNCVQLPAIALMDTLDKAQDKRHDFFLQISCVILGTLSMGVMSLPPLKIACFVVAVYSQRRTVLDPFNRIQRPIITFSTQYGPILSALATSFVMEAFSKKCTRLFSEASLDIGLRHFIATIGKITLMEHCVPLLLTLSERCDLRGAKIAEGDILVLSIFLIGRIIPPETSDSSGILARHEAFMLEEMRNMVAKAPHHCDDRLEASLLPMCQPLLEAIAIEDNVNPRLIDLYVATVMKKDSAWYTEHGGLSWSEQHTMEREAIKALLPSLEDVQKLEIYLTAMPQYYPN